MEKSIQELFDDYENKSLAVEEAKRQLDEAALPDLSTEKFISAQQADEHLILCIEHERNEKRLENLSQEWVEIQDSLVEKLCKINTKVLVKDKRDNADLVIYCEGGSIRIDELDVTQSKS